LILAKVALGLGATMAMAGAYVFHEGVIRVDVDERRAGGSHVHFLVPATVVAAGMHFMPKEQLNRATEEARPFLPVNAFALPELTTSARAFPAFSFSRHHSTGADGHFERVVTPATVVPSSNNASSTSVRPLYLIPAAPVARRTPATSGISGTFLGAKGETVEDIARLLCAGYENARRGGRAST